MTECSASRFWKKARISNIILFNQHCTEGPRQCNKTRKKSHADWKGKVKLLFSDNMIVYVEKNPQKSKAIRVSQYNKATRYKVKVDKQK